MTAVPPMWVWIVLFFIAWLGVGLFICLLIGGAIKHANEVETYKHEDEESEERPAWRVTAK